MINILQLSSEYFEETFIHLCVIEKFYVNLPKIKIGIYDHHSIDS